MDEAWKPSKKQQYFGNLEELNGKLLSLKIYSVNSVLYLKECDRFLQAASCSNEPAVFAAL